MKSSLVLIGTALVAGLTLTAGVIHGRITNRWGPSPDALAAAERLQGVPVQIGAWKAVRSAPLSENTTEMLRCAGYLNRVYLNEVTGETINVTVLIGPPGEIWAHTPEGCRGRGSLVQPRKLVPVDDHEFWAPTFREKNLEAAFLRDYYAWSAGGCWSAPENPRFKFAGKPYLYKIQVTGRVLRGSSDEEMNDSCRSFLGDFLPVVQEYLVNSSPDRK